jgi:hypothetical protein
MYTVSFLLWRVYVYVGTHWHEKMLMWMVMMGGQMLDAQGNDDAEPLPISAVQLFEQMCEVCGGGIARVGCLDDDFRMLSCCCVFIIASIWVSIPHRCVSVNAWVCLFILWYSHLCMLSSFFLIITASAIFSACPPLLRSGITIQMARVDDRYVWKLSGP